MNTTWKTLYSHKWTDISYNHALQFLLHNTLPPHTTFTPSMLKSFKIRLQFYSALNNHLVHFSNSPPPWSISTTHSNSFTFYVVKPSSIHHTILQLFNNLGTTAMNYRTLYDKIIRAYYLGISRQDVIDFLKKQPLNLKQINHKNPHEYIQSYRPMYPFHYWQIDTIDMRNIKQYNRVPGSKQLTYKHILVIIDIFSKFIYLYPLIGNIKNSDGSDLQRMYAEISNHLRKLCLGGDIPEKIGADNAFRAKAFTSFCNEFNINTYFGLPYSPQTQGFVENKNKQIKAYIYFHFNRYKEKQYQYFDILDSVAFSINNTKHSMTNTTPMQLHRGRDIPVSINNDAVKKGPESFPGSKGDEFIGNNNENLTNYDLTFEKCDETNMKNYEKYSKELYEKRIDVVRQRLHQIAEKREKNYETKHLKQNISLGNYVQVPAYIWADQQLKAIQLRL